MPRPPRALWQLRHADAQAVGELERALGLPTILAQVLVGRGLDEADACRRYLEPRLSDLDSPAGMADLDRAVERLAAALTRGERIGIFGDYDVDGVTSAAVLGDYLRRCGAAPLVRVARRDEGYGFQVEHAEELGRGGCELLVLTDCGTSDHAAVARATELGMDVIAVDHHRVTEGSWPGFALVNPQRPGCAFAYKGLCSAGLAFYVAAALRRLVGASRGDVPDPRDQLDLVALGTVADVAPLTGVNRILVARGLELLGRTTRPGLRELLRLAEIVGRAPTAEDVAWRLAPRLNAPGRLGAAQLAFDCLWHEDRQQAEASARRCHELNEERRALQARLLVEATAQAEAQVALGRAFLLVSGDDWHPGVAGILAGRLADRFGRPAAAVAFQGDRGRGSVRGARGVDLVPVLSGCVAHLEKFGGHAQAAGFSLRRESLEALADALHEGMAGQVPEAPVLELDGEVRLSSVDERLCAELGRLAPHGEGNPEPIFLGRGLTVQSARVVGGGHLRLQLRQGEVVRDAIGFGLGDRLGALPPRVDAAFAPGIDTYQGPRLRLRCVDLAAEGENLPEGGAA
ncbi:MAG: single-stranded-DNA-specific exonuclease RecJ [Deltaproteobacteria bacterium]|nr:single-stranded-DNA-specific exonuclease RecJ [Deltaproteobacteria bacterium]